MDAGTWIAAGTLLTAFIGLGLVVGQLHQQRRAMRAEFGNLYIERYWEIDDALLMVPKQTELHRHHRHRYLRLFEDEFDVAKLGFLDVRQWQAWHSVLDDPKAILQLKDDLNVCNPKGDEFLRLRACLDQREYEGRPHSTRECMGNGRRREHRTRTADPPAATHGRPPRDPQPDKREDTRA